MPVMRANKLLIAAATLIVAVAFWRLDHVVSAPPGAASSPAGEAASRGQPSILPGFLPVEARATLDRIARGGPFLHRQDGSVFGNREGLLPPKPRGYYREYTVETPGLRYRGARRIISGGQPPVVYYYTDDHYRSFRAFQVAR